MRLRTHLVALVLAALVPVLGFAALVIRENDRLQLVATERGMRETAHAVATTVDETMVTAITTLEALAQSDHLDRPNLAAFQAYSRRVNAAQEFTNIFLFDREGQALTVASPAPDGRLPKTRQLAELARARDERRPVVSDLFDGAANRQIVGIYVPVVRGGEVRFVLSAGIGAKEFSAVLRAQQFASDSIASIQDSRNIIVARTVGEAEAIGKKVPFETPGREGWIRGRSREGREVYAAYSTASRSGWRVVLASPVERVDAPLRRALGRVLAGAAVAAGVAGALAFLFGRHIENAVGSLVRIARALERGEPVAPLRTGVKEVNALSEQLSAAADLVRAREHEAALREHQARAIGEVAHALNASPDLDAMLRTAVGAVRRLVDADASRIALVDEAGLVLRFSSTASTAMGAGFVIERGRGLGGLVWATARPVRTDDIGADPRFAGNPYMPATLAEGIVSCMGVPIMTAGIVVGVMYASRVTARPFSAADELALMTLADHAAVALQKARLLAGEHAARAEAEAASRGKDELLAMLGHELRNPLSAIASAVHILESPGAPPESDRLAREIIARQNAHLAHLVDDLLDVARVTSGKIVLSRRPLELAETVRRAVAALTTTGRTERHHLSLALSPVWADVDETRFEQIVTNLLGNALKFTRPGGAIEITLEEHEGEAVLSVRDTGVGIPPEMLARVFEMFVQGERGPRGGTGGLGLGLTLVRRIVELHGGRVEAASEGPGRGSAFTVRLPTIAAPVPALSRELLAADLDGNGPRRRVLLVEDNADARAMLRRILEMEGHQVYEAADGEAGLEAALRLRPDVALIDVGLPGLDGYEVARAIRRRDGAAMRLVALTGYGQPEDRRHALAVGFDAHLVKPASPGALLSAIQGSPAERS